MFEFEIACKVTTKSEERRAKSEEFAAIMLFFNYSFTFRSFV